MSTRTILAIETSGKVCSVSLCSFEYSASVDNSIEFYHICNDVEFQIISEYTVNIGNRHDKLCAELCCRILKDNDIPVSKLDAVAVSCGPGSFTGLRVGMSLAKGLCFDLLGDSSFQGVNILPLIAVPTLTAVAINALAYLANSNLFLDDILAIVPSHSNLVYHQKFDFHGLAVSAIEFSDLETVIRSSSTSFIATSSKLEIVSARYPSYVFQTSSVAVAMVAVSEYIKGNFTSSSEIQPIYLTDFIPGKNFTTN